MEKSDEVDITVLNITSALQKMLMLLVNREATEVVVKNGDGYRITVYRDGSSVKCEIDRLL